MKYKQLSYEERVQIGLLHQQGLSIRGIAKHLGRSPNTIARELKEKQVKGEYVPRKAQHKTYVRRYLAKHSCNKVAMDKQLMAFVLEKLKEGWSPERLAGYLKTRGVLVSKSSIYRFIHSRCLERYLFSRRVKKKSGPKRGTAKTLKDKRLFIERRPVLNGSGHLEADFIVSRHNPWCLLVVVDRYTRYTWIKKLPNKRHLTVTEGFRTILGEVKVKTLTLDNDVSFSHWRELERELKTKIFFTHPYASWEKGLVENTNRWIRVWVPKRSDIGLVSERELDKAREWLNKIPRQCLGYRRAEVLWREVS